MKYYFLAGLLLLQCVSLVPAAPKPTELTASEKKAGWRLLFDGHSLAGWRAYGKAEAPKQGWVVVDGCLKKEGGVKGGDLITVDQFTNYDLRWEWRIGAKGNNGVKYLVTEARPTAPGPEYQMIDDALHAGPDEARFSTASLYHILPPAEDKPLRPPGKWNSSRILIQGKRVEHWLNGKKVLEYELESPELKAAIAKSKFKDAAGFGDKITGHIMLTDHNDEAWFRKIRIRELRKNSGAEAIERNDSR